MKGTGIRFNKKYGEALKGKRSRGTDNPEASDVLAGSPGAGQQILEETAGHSITRSCGSALY